ncbi:hypothetical protein J25TS5_46840 [Paenibacillus faecis]|nr:hypothetical protein J25TS5_46840 [Paenibacillus faecis]
MKPPVIPVERRRRRSIAAWLLYRGVLGLLPKGTELSRLFFTGRTVLSYLAEW